ncbi:MAG: MFS transporter [Candidatus Binatus sp.]|uniref:MFS transporter n=1 Tax=Candidatus Binatus sp. TaxID=2811406 RepID=UPI00271AA750|nr:MFS transporter [Candidatus Binatus sp.]MDO8432034.1 MFS transporter [Candidatus Binatus sp.]
MTARERRGWIIVGAIFVTMFFIWGAINSGAVFFVPVLKHFGWTRAKLSVALSIGWVTGGAAGPFIGWLADRIDPKKMMVTGATITGLLWLALSRANSFGEFLVINGLFGICVGASTSIPVSLLIANWFEHRRGLAMGIAFSGSTLGGAVMTIVASHAIVTSGWRVGYVTLALPILLIVVPLIVFFVRNRNSTEGRESADAASAVPGVQVDSASYELPGLELSQATRTRSFWLICAAQFFAGSSLGLGPHFVAYLTGVGYSPTFSATVVSIYLLMTTAGMLLGGPLADRFTSRIALTSTYTLASLGTAALLAAAHPIALAVSVLGAGFAGGALAVQTPLVMIESLGVRRLGSVLGVTGIFYTIGAAISPIATGRIFDVTGSYSMAIGSFVVFLMVCAFAIFRCRPLGHEQLLFETPAPSRAA